MHSWLALSADNWQVQAKIRIEINSQGVLLGTTGDQHHQLQGLPNSAPSVGNETITLIC